MNIKIKKIRETATIPTYGSAMAAGADLYADIEKPIRLKPHETYMVPTGIAMSIPEGYFGAVYARSGLACKENLRPANCVGVIDADYTGEIMVALHNDGEYLRQVDPGERIAQIVIQAYETAAFEVVDELNETERGNGGFGSTGKE